MAYASIWLALGITPLTAAQEQDLQLQRHFQQDSILLAGKTIYINIFFHWRRLESNSEGVLLTCGNKRIFEYFFGE